MGEAGYRSVDRFHTQIHSGVEERWYFVHRDSLVVGYSARDKRRLGWIGANGFYTSMSHAERYPGHDPISSGSGDTFLGFATAAFRIDWNNYHVTLLHRASAEEVIWTGAEIWTDSWINLGSKLAAYAITSSKGILLFDPAGHKLSSFPYAFDPYTY